MAYDVKLTHLPPLALGPNDVRFDVRYRGKPLGVLQVSKGRLDWFPAHASKRAKRLNWAQFSRMMDTDGHKTTAVKRRR